MYNENENKGTGHEMQNVEEKLFCISLVAKNHGHHVAGFERLGTYDEISGITQEIIEKTVLVGHGALDEVSLKIEALKHFNVMTGKLPDVIFIPLKNQRDGRKFAERILLDGGVSITAVKSAMGLLTRTFGQGGDSLPGVIILDSFTGERLDGQKSGVVVGRVDLTERMRVELNKDHEKKFGQIRDWLVQSAKILSMPGTVAELLMSNDLRNQGGLVSTPEKGVMFLSKIRSNENEVGGRVLFVRSKGFDLEEGIKFLESSVLIIDSVGSIR